MDKKNVSGKNIGSLWIIRNNNMIDRKIFFSNLLLK